jgi:mono/diheme cytochrome c family protein
VIVQKSQAFSPAGLFVVASVMLTGVAPAAKAGPPSFSSTVQPIFTDNCVACHQTGSAQQGLVLEDGEAFAHLAGRKSSEAPMSLVTPRQPEQSYLIRKLEGTHLSAGGAGERMPMGGAPLSAAELEAIRQWVAAGAQNN